MKIWNYISLKAARTGPDAEEFFGGVIAGFPSRGSEISEQNGGIEFRVYFDPGVDVESVAEQLVLEAKNAYPDAGVSFEIGSVEDQKWQLNWREYFQPVQVSEKITILPSWEPSMPNAGKIEIRIDPGMAFGTGTHATTQLCMRLMEKHLRPGWRVLDAGTGSGILCIAAAQSGAGRSVGFDLDPAVLENLALNRRLNGIAPGKADYFIGPAECLRGTGFDLILCNMLSHEFAPLLPRLRELNAPGGMLILGGLLTTEAPETEERLEQLGWRVIEHDTLEEWSVLAAAID